MACSDTIMRKYNGAGVNVMRTDNLLCKQYTDIHVPYPTHPNVTEYLWLLRICRSVYIHCLIIILTPHPHPHPPFKIFQNCLCNVLKHQRLRSRKTISHRNWKLEIDKMYLFLMDCHNVRMKIVRLINECKWFTLFSIKLSKS